MAALRNLAIGIHRQDGHTDIAAAYDATTAAPSGPSASPDKTGPITILRKTLGSWG